MCINIRKQKLSKYTHPKTSQEEVPRFTTEKEQVPAGSFLEDMSSSPWDHLPTQVELPFPGREPSAQFQRGSAERLTKPNWKTGNRMTRKNSMIFTGVNSQEENQLTVLEPSRGEVGLSDPSGAHPARPAALGHLFLDSLAVAL